MVPLIISSVVDGVLIGLAYGLVAAGLGLIWGVMDIVNFAHGEHMLIAMYVTLLASAELSVSPLILLPVNAALMFLVGYGTYVVIIKRTMGGPILGQVLCTFGLLLVIRYGIIYLVGPSTRTVDNFAFAGSTTTYGISVSYPAVLTAAVSLLTIGLLYAILQRSSIGKAIRATAQDKQAAQVMGINTDRIYAISWGIGLAATGIAGTMIATYFPIQPNATPGIWTIASFAAVALGGLGSILGAVVGGIVIGLVQNLGASLLDPSYQQLYVYIVLIGALLYQREGILDWVSGQ
ncbi:branched-chain amino acid ABC transporter permease [Haloquadratum walsbyi]|jgi:Branched-chain amino acid ABC-type transport system, permease components|uniref:Branched-chain amino acid ABC-type transport system, permease component n=1 Tax=Haloquadratum walsbyi J07HQW2 TaxID=1238425 RepID=U1PTP6_9EURY|nr:branched-chain amino acid ABC transporter permease [Haloquadratum walsbyi]ERG97177.1 MAG: branched-chain amino acid ABC-type transport system, permease component [Haloquadratum walsbyi J07HQW2]